MAARIRVIDIFLAAIALVLSFSFPISIGAAQLDEQQSSPQNAADPKAAAAPTGQISGHVYRADNGAPLPKTIVIISSRSQSNSERSTRTAADGSFSFAAVVPGTYVISARRPGFITTSYGVESSRPGVNVYEFSIKPGQIFNKVEIRMSAAGVISGTVTDEDGDPALGVVVAAVRPSYSAGGSIDESSEETTLTDDRGNFRLTGLSPGDYFVRAGGFADSSDPQPPKGSWNYEQIYFPNVNRMDAAEIVKVAAGMETAGISLRVLSATQNLYVIRGKLLSLPNETTVSFGTVRLIHGDNQRRAQEQWADGVFTISGVAPGKYTVLAEYYETTRNHELLKEFKNDMYFAEAQVTVDDADASVGLNLVPAGAVHGMLRLEGTDKSETGDLGEADIELNPVSGIGNVADDSDFMVESNGKYLIRRLSPGDYWFSVRINEATFYVKQVLCDDQDLTLQPVTIELGSERDCRVTVRTDSAIISGQVMDGDKPIPGFIVVAIPESRASRKAPYNTQVGRTSSSGQFLLSGLAPGDYLLFAVPRDDQERYFALDFADKNQRDAVRVTVKPSEAKTLTLKPTNPM